MCVRRSCGWGRANPCCCRGGRKKKKRCPIHRVSLRNPKVDVCLLHSLWWATSDGTAYAVPVVGIAEACRLYRTLQCCYLPMSAYMGASLGRKPQEKTMTQNDAVVNAVSEAANHIDAVAKPEIPPNNVGTV